MTTPSAAGLVSEPDATCTMCWADHCLVQPGFSCTVHGHAFAYAFTQDGEDRDECPEDGCTQGMWTS